MLLLFLFMFAVTFMQGINAYLSSASDAELESPDFLTKLEDMERFYGTMEDSIWTLFAAVTGGIDWAEVSKPIGYLGSFYKYVFLLYLLFVLFALMNILTGIFVHVAIDSCKMNREIAIEAAIANKEMLIKEIVQLFHEADKDCSGTLSWQEFHDYMQDEKIKAFFMALELDMSSAGRVFDIIDVMRDGELDICEFVQGCVDGLELLDTRNFSYDGALCLNRLEQHLKHSRTLIAVRGWNMCHRILPRALPLERHCFCSTKLMAVSLVLAWVTWTPHVSLRQVPEDALCVCASGDRSPLFSCHRVVRCIVVGSTWTSSCIERCFQFLAQEYPVQCAKSVCATHKDADEGVPGLSRVGFDEVAGLR